MCGRRRGSRGWGVRGRMRIRRVLCWGGVIVRWWCGLVCMYGAKSEVFFGAAAVIYWYAIIFGRLSYLSVTYLLRNVSFVHHSDQYSC